MNDDDPRDLLRVWLPGMSAATGRGTARVLASTVRSMRTAATAGPVATCEVARDAAQKLGLPGPVVDCLDDILTTWHGKGYPPRAGDEIAVATRLMQVASVAVRFQLAQGSKVAVAQVRQRAGHELDPDLADVFLTRSADLTDDLDTIDAYEAALDCEPDPVHRIDAADLDSVARTFGELVDLKSPTLHGHCTAVAETATTAATTMNLDGIESLRTAGYLHDVGKVAVSSRIWDKTRPWSATERDQVHLHPYHGERIVARVQQLAGLAPMIGGHHERCDGSGYHRGLTADRLTMAERVLAAADAYRDLVEDRPGAPRMPATDAARRLRADAREGCLDGDAVEAVVEAAGHLRRTRPSRPAGLTERQIDVVRLLAAGLSNRAIADRLVISPRTAEHHVQDVYTRIGASSRAAAALFAMEHGLLGDHEGEHEDEHGG